jgi:hypothetical protein
MATKDDRCWPGYEPLKGKKPNRQGGCRPEADSKLTPSEKQFHGKRRSQLDQWAADRPKSPKSAAQHLAAPSKKTTKKSAPRKSALKKTAAKRNSLLV